MTITIDDRGHVRWLGRDLSVTTESPEWDPAGTVGNLDKDIVETPESPALKGTQKRPLRHPERTSAVTQPDREGTKTGPGKGHTRKSPLPGLNKTSNSPCGDLFGTRDSPGRDAGPDLPRSAWTSDHDYTIVQGATTPCR